MEPQPTERKNYTFGYWLNGWRKAPGDASPDVLCFESGRYGFQLNVDDLPAARFGVLDDGLGYAGALEAGGERLAGLPDAELIVEVDIGGSVYRALTCRAGIETDVKRLRHARLWESGRFVQHFDLRGLVFRNADGDELGCDGTLDLVAWPESLTLTADLSPAPIYRDGPIPGLSGNGLCVIDKPRDIPHAPALDPETLTATTLGFVAASPGGTEARDDPAAD